MLPGKVSGQHLKRNLAKSINKPQNVEVVTIYFIAFIDLELPEGQNYRK